ncbi:MAG: exoZ1 [Micavibrio sp.]|nr:exoZ1 [Micavibrio sp.]
MNQNAAGASARQDILSLQYLRAVAALGVVLFHLGEPFGLNLMFGRAGVDIFFIISGFIMWLVTRDRETRPGVFIKKRLLRIVPMYWLVTLFLALCVYIKPNIFSMDHLTLSHLAQSLLFIPHISPSGNKFPLLSQGWTLNYEMFFYVLFTLSLFAGSRGRQLAGLSAVIVVAVLCGIFFNPSSPVLITYTSTLLLEFLAGIFMAEAWLRSRLAAGRPLALLAIIAGLSGIALASYLRPAIPEVLYFGVPCALLVFGTLSLDRQGGVPRWGWLKVLGDASYSIYLTHFFCWTAVSLALAKSGLSRNLYEYGATVAMAIVVGLSAYYAAERPMTRFLSRTR